MMRNEKVNEHLLEALETEIGGVKVYEAALQCATNKDLKKEWEEYLQQTKNHATVLENVCRQLAINTDEITPGRQVVRYIGESLVKAMQLAREKGDAEAAQMVAAECIVHAETKDHMNWEMIGVLAEQMADDEKQILKEAYDQVEDEEDEHLYHTKGWARELHLKSLGLEAVLPPPEEKKDVKSAREAADTMKERMESLK